MLGKQSKQIGLIDSTWINHLIPKDSVYYNLAKWGDRLVTDEEFAHLYSDTGRPSNSPAVLTRAMILMHLEGCSDREAEDRTKFDIRWKWALGLSLDNDGIDHTVLCRFRIRLRLHNHEKIMFDRLLQLAIEGGIIDPNSIQAVDSTIIHGAGAVQDTYTLIRKAIEKVLSLAKSSPRLRKKLLKSLVRKDYETNKKPDIAWDNKTEQDTLLSELIRDSYSIMEIMSNEKEATNSQIADAIQLLSCVTDQDVEVINGRVQIRNGVAKDRVISTTDPEMRHGHKSRHRKIDGYKIHITEDIETELITSTAVTPANAPDSEPVETMIDEQGELGIKPTKLVGDSAYGSGKLRSDVEAKGVEIVAKVPSKYSHGDFFGKDRFIIYLEKDQVRCPAGKRTKEYTTTKDKDGLVSKVFRFSPNKCNTCILKNQCTKSNKGRTITLSPHEKRMQQAKQYQQTPEFDELYHLRPIVERKIAHVIGQCDRKARYIGEEKVSFQMIWTTAAQNLNRLCVLLTGFTEDKLKCWDRALDKRLEGVLMS